MPPAAARLPVALEAYDLRIYRNSGSLPRFFLVRRLHLAKNTAEALAYLARRDFEPADEAVVEAEESAGDWAAEHRHRTGGALLR